MQIRKLPIPRKPPTIGEMDTPIALYDAEYKPDTKDGYDIKLKHVANLWAKVTYGAATFQKNNSPDNDPEAANLYLIQATGVFPEKGMYLIHDDLQYRVEYTKFIDSRRMWLAVYAIEHGKVEHGDFTVNLALVKKDKSKSETDPDKPVDSIVPSKELDNPVEDLWSDLD